MRRRNKDDRASSGVPDTSHESELRTQAQDHEVARECPDCHGFYGASSMERLPTELAIADQTRQFKRIARPTREPIGAD